LSISKQKYLVYTEAHTHYSIAKIAEIMGLISIKVAPLEDGSMDINDLKVKMNDLTKENSIAGVVILLTYGTTQTAAIDDAPKVKAVLEEVQ